MMEYAIILKHPTQETYFCYQIDLLPGAEIYLSPLKSGSSFANAELTLSLQKFQLTHHADMPESMLGWMIRTRSIGPVYVREN
jgi:hypothetical protein